MAEKKTSIASSLAAHQARIADRIHSIDLRDLRLLRGFCNIPIPSEKKLLPELTQSIGIKSDSADTRNVVAVQISFSILGNYENGDEGLRVEAVIGLLYAVNWINQATEEDIAAFSQAVAVNNAWPYWREFVQSMTVRMGLPPSSVFPYCVWTSCISHNPSARQIQGKRRQTVSQKNRETKTSKHALIAPSSFPSFPSNLAPRPWREPGPRHGIENVPSEFGRVLITS